MKFLLPLLLLLLSATNPALAGEAKADRASAPPVQAILAASPTEAKIGQEVNVTLTLKIAESWHIYAASNGVEVQQPLDIAMILPSGSESVSDWVWPVVADAFDGRNSKIYSGEQIFRRRIKVTAVKGEMKLSAVVAYQACSSEMCQPPETLVASTSIKINNATGKKPERRRDAVETVLAPKSVTK